MKILFLALYDAGGQNQLLTEAVNKYSPNDRARSLVCQEFYLGYGTDLLYPVADKRQVDEALASSDFFCFQESILSFPEHDIISRLTPDNHMVRWVGTMALETLPHIFKANVTGRIPMQATTTDYDIASEVGFSTYIPLSIDFEQLPKPQTTPGKIRIAHAPTDREVKRTDLFLAAMEQVQKEYPYVEPVIVEGKPWKECMEIKATCDMTYENIWRGLFGHNSVEAWALGQPVLGGVNFYTKALHPDCPIVACNDVNSLRDRIIELVKNDDLRKAIGQRGVEFARQNFDVKKNVWRWLYLFHFIKSGKQKQLIQFNLEGYDWKR